MKRLTVWIAGVLCVASCATLAAVEGWTIAHEVRTADQNGDGRPDVWRHFDAHGQITQVDVDSNFDGKPDIEEYYQRGTLVRRESDRNFNGQADLIEEFDAATHGQTRSVIDVNFDGTADLLVLFRDGHPVFVKRPERAAATPDRVERSVDSGAFVPLFDPFESETAVRAGNVVAAGDACVGLSTCGGLPAPRFSIVDLRRLSADVALIDTSFGASALCLSRSSRAPPLV